MLILFLLYTPLALSIAAVAFFAAQRLSRRGLGRFPRTATAFHRNLAGRLNATAVVDDAGISWRLHHPVDLRITLPFDPGFSGDAAGHHLGTAAAAERPEPHNFAFVLRWPVPKIRRGTALPVAFGVPVELLSLLCTSEDGLPPAGAPQAPPPPFQVKSASIERILREWPAFDRDMDLLAASPMTADFQRAVLLLRDEVVWLDQPIWPQDQAPPAPFIINLIEDEAWILVFFPGRSVKEAVQTPEWMAEQMNWFAAAAPGLCSGVSRAQMPAREFVHARRARRKADAEAAERARAAATVAAINADIEAAWPPPPQAP